MRILSQFVKNSRHSILDNGSLLLFSIAMLSVLVLSMGPKKVKTMDRESVGISNPRLKGFKRTRPFGLRIQIP